MTKERVDLGRRAEEIAAEHLRTKRHVIVARNFRGAGGEIDLVTSLAGMLVFVEVRSRRCDRFGTGLESVDRRKRERIRRAAEAYLQRHGGEDRAARFDVISIEWREDGPHLEHVESAFECAAE